MKKLLKVLGVAVGVFVLLIVALVVTTNIKAGKTWEDTPYPDVHATDDPESIARGEYLVHGAVACTMCHVTLEKAKTIEHGEKPALTGGMEVDAAEFGVIRTPNITPDEQTGIGDWTDPELARIIRYGIDRKGKPSLSMWFAAAELSDQDLVDIISYLRTTKPIRNQTPVSERGFMYNVILAWIFEPSVSKEFRKTSPPMAATLERGEYLATGPANCKNCHSDGTPFNGFAATKPFGGAHPEPDMFKEGMEFCAPNLTSHSTGRLANWTLDHFKKRFRSPKAVETSGMPWVQLGNMTDEDLEAIYMYLKSVEPVDNDTGPVYRAAGWTPDMEEATATAGTR